ncbi:tonsoku-like protein [Aplysia californica]|uniref:Tonsoku-like protein n=1 Tax=Aplysia californica TaxID=6500 RepID=A0ABM0JRM8_APLCA|nr:tonsoku-like protein [Aplysia californica]
MDDEDVKELNRYQKDKKKAEARGKLGNVAELCNCIGELYSKYGKYEEAIQEHEQERHLCQAIGDRIGEAVACRKIGECHCSLGAYAEALFLQKRHLTLARECQNHLEEQRAWATIGRTYLHQAESQDSVQSAGASKKAERAFAQALEVCEKVKDSLKLPEYMAMKCRLYMNLGVVFDARGESAQSGDVMKRAVLIAEKFKLDDELYMCQETLANMYQKGENYSLALRSLEVALRLSRKLRNKVGERESLVQKALIHVSTGDLLAAKHSLKQAHRLRIDSAVNEVKLIKVFKSVNKIQDACQDLETESDDRKLGKLHEVIADNFVELGLYNKAVEHYIHVLEWAHLMSSEERAAIYVSVAQTYADLRQFDNALYYYQRELEEWGDNQEQACRTYLNMADLEEKKGSKYGVTGKLYMSAFEAARKAKHRKLQIQSLEALIAVQKIHKQATHQQETEKKLAMVQRKKAQEDKSLNEEDSSMDEEEEEKEENKGDLSISDLTVSEDSDEGGPSFVESGRPKKSNIARKNEKGETPLHRACIAGNLKKVKTLISQGHPVNPRDYCGWLPLHEACNYGYRDIVEYLLDCGAWMNDRGDVDCEGLTPLMDAANCGNFDVVSLLVDRGANVLAKDDHGNTALDRLRSWHGATDDVLSAADTLEYQRVQALLLRKMGRSEQDSSGTPTSGFTAHSVNEEHNLSKKVHVGSKPTTSGMRTKPKSFRLPDLEDTDSSEEDVALLRSPPKKTLSRKKPVASTKRKNPIEDETVQMEDFSDDGDFIFPLSPAQDDPSTNPTEAYRSAICAIASSAPKRLEADFTQTDKKSDSSSNAQTKRTALLAEDEVGDDWLIEDLKAPKLKRKSTAVKEILTTTSTRATVAGYTKRRKVTDKASKFSELVRRRQKAKSDGREGRRRPSFVDSDEEGSLDGNSRSSDVVSSSGIPLEEEETLEPEHTEQYNIQDEKENYVWDSDDDILCEIDPVFDYSLSASQSDVSTLPEANRPSDITVTNEPSIRIPVSQHTSTENSSVRFTESHLVQKSSNRENSHIDRRHSFSSIRNEDGDTHASWKHNSERSCGQPRQDTLYTQRMSPAMAKEVTPERRSDPVARPVLRFKVQVEDKTLLIPLQASDSDKNISWLAREVGERYFSMYLQRPALALSTSDGILLCPVDPISSVVADNDHLKATVTLWERPQLEERYAKACQMFCTEANHSVSVRLHDCEASGQLSLSDLGLGQQQLQPVYRALEGQTTLTNLSLAGNRLGDAGLVPLTELLQDMPNLKSLNLETNGFSSKGLCTLSKALKNGCLQSLQHLNLSHNCLGDSAAEWLTNILRDLISLTDFSVAACSLSAKVFTPSFCDALRGRSLKRLIFAENQICDEGIALLLSNLHADSLLALDLSHTRSESTAELSEKLQTFIASDEKCSLTELNLSGCHLVANDVLFLNRLVAEVSSLQKLSISQNQQVTCSSLQKLLYLSAYRGSGMEELTARGCSITAPLSSEFLAAFKEKMRSARPLRKFVFTCRGLGKVEVESIHGMWTSVWGEEAVVKVLGPSVSLSVV